MKDFLKVLLNIRSLRSILHELTLEQLKEASEKIESVYLERVALVEKEQAAQAEHMNKIAEFQVMLAEAGIDPCELVGSRQVELVCEKIKWAPRSAKYRYVENGVEKTWTGQGRMPKYLVVQQSKGLQLDEFLI
ncbi:H-NS family histone-like protein [Aeromonas hydrophila]